MTELYFGNAIEDIKQRLKKELSNIFSKEDKIAVKIHFGEPGNKYALKAEFFKKIIDILNELGYNCFLFDSLVAYNSPRGKLEGHYQVAKDNGFDFCDIKISDEAVNIESEHLNMEVCKDLTEADGVLVISHVKGHFCCGFGGAIKNLGMGALSKKTKKEIHHGGKPKLTGNCISCGLCKELCPSSNAIKIKGKAEFDYGNCYGGSNCIIHCPQNALEPNIALFDTLLAEGADAAYKNFKKSYYINVIKDVAKLCDCIANAGPVIAKDIGILIGKDPVAIDKASLDLIKEKEGKDVFEKAHHKSALLHIKEAERLGMGGMDYVIG